MSQNLRILIPSILLLINVLALAGSGTTDADSSTWPSFRGQAGDGLSSSKDIFKGKENLALKVAWQVPIGSGYSGIAVDRDTVVTMAVSGEHDVALAFDINTGKQLWSYQIGPKYVGHSGSLDGPIATPAISNDQVFILGPHGHLSALNLKTGKANWSSHLVKDFKANVPYYGFSTSPLIFKDTLIIQMGGEAGLAVGLDMETGEKKWSFGKDNVQYQSPLIYGDPGQEILAAAGNTRIVFVDLNKNTLIGDYAHEGSSAIGAGSMSPIYTGTDQVFLAHKNDSSSLFSLKGEDGQAAFKEVWNHRSIRNSYNVPIYHDGHIYAFSSRLLVCVDTKDGSIKWRSRQPGDGFLIQVDDHLVIQNKKGSVHVVKATPDGYHEVASVDVFDELAWSPPAFASGAIFARGIDGIARINISDQKAATNLATADDPDTGFEKFIAGLEGKNDKQARVEAYLAKHKQMPIIEGRHAHFLIRSKAKDVALGGDMFGIRQERMMHHLEGTDLFHYSVELKEDALISYAFIEDYGTAKPDPLNPRQFETMTYTDEMEIGFGGQQITMSWMAMPKWKPSPLTQIKPKHEPKLTTQELDSKTTNGKVKLEIYLPQGYAESEAQYPVLYVNNPSAISLGRWDKLLRSLQEQGGPAAIAVFIHGVNPFRPDLSNKLIAEEVLPWVDTNYRTIKKPEARTSIGMGITGTSAINLALAHSDLFGKTATHSPIFLNLTGFKKNTKEATAGAPYIYIDRGFYDVRNDQEGWDKGMEATQALEHLKANGYNAIGVIDNSGSDWASWYHRSEALLNAVLK